MSEFIFVDKFIRIFVLNFKDVQLIYDSEEENVDVSLMDDKR